MYNGFKITTQSQWQSRRVELKEAFLYYMYGHMPPSSPVSVVSIDPDVLLGPMIKRTVHLKTGPGGALPFSINLDIPASGGGPIPLRLGSDLSRSPLADNWQPGTGENASIGVANLRTLVSEVTSWPSSAATISRSTTRMTGSGRFQFRNLSSLPRVRLGECCGVGLGI